ncbi:hypothetical protein GV829_05500 [Sphingomonas lacunae]|uniref:DUF4870 domain-containing protein n=1 Tax=Sphingomonas lacunae TaxID=2698828 RepID=A0A6M4ASD1_9SPHN|nr:hypothetical protein [Sphingomonas lacunae]QJQ31975.1 hypothetical protein GV829_05500 [Sphingomonas lacunae]
MTDPSGQPGTSGGANSVNKPTIIAILYISSFLFGITGIVGLVLGYVWRNEVRGSWEESHMTYLIRTFWIGFILSVISVPLMFLLIGFPLLLAAMVQLVVRSVFSLTRAQKQEPMPDPETLLW